MKKVQFYEDISKVKDSMQFESDTVIVDMEDSECGLTASIEVRGEVNVTWKGKEYRKVSEFPEDLMHEIMTNPNWANGEDIYVSNNNWFEVFVRDTDGFCLLSDVVDIGGIAGERVIKLLDGCILNCYLHQRNNPPMQRRSCSHDFIGIWERDTIRSLNKERDM